MNWKKLFAGALVIGGAHGLSGQCTTPILTDDYSNPALWTNVDVVNRNGTIGNYDGTVMYYTRSEWTGTAFSGTSVCAKGACASREMRAYRSVGMTLSNTSWRAVCKINVKDGNAPAAFIMALTSGTNNPVADGNDDSDYGSCSGTQSTAYTYYNQDMIGVCLQQTSGPTTFSSDPFVSGNWKFIGTSRNDAGLLGADGTSTGINLPALNTNYWVCLERLSLTQARVSIFSDAALTTHVPGSPQCFTVSATNGGLRYIQHATNVLGFYPRSLEATVDNLRIYNNCPGNLLTATASPTTICTGLPVTLTASSGFTSYTWSPGGSTSNPTTVTAGALGTYTYTVTGTLPGGCSLQATTTYTVAAGNIYDPSFSLLVSPIGGGQYHATATPVAGSTNYAISTDIYGGAGFAWFVEELDPSTLAVIPGTTFSNPSQWWTTAATESFGNYPISPATGSYGTFQDGHMYRITRGVWSSCEPYTTYSLIFMPCSGCRLSNGENAIITVDQTQQPAPDPLVVPVIGEKAAVLDVFPNPANDVVTVNVPGEFNNGTIEIVDVLGKTVVMPQEINGRKSVSLGLSQYGLAPGVYFVRCVNGEHKIEQRLVITE